MELAFMSGPVIWAAGAIVIAFGIVLAALGVRRIVREREAEREAAPLDNEDWRRLIRDTKNPAFWEADNQARMIRLGLAGGSPPAAPRPPQTGEQEADDTAAWLRSIGDDGEQLTSAQRQDAFATAAKADARLIDGWIRAGGCAFDHRGRWIVPDMPEHRSWDRDWLVVRGIVLAEDLVSA